MKSFMTQTQDENFENICELVVEKRKIEAKLQIYQRAWAFNDCEFDLNDTITCNQGRTKWVVVDIEYGEYADARPYHTIVLKRILKSGFLSVNCTRWSGYSGWEKTKAEFNWS